MKRSGDKLYTDVKRIKVIEEYKYMGCMVGEDLECKDDKWKSKTWTH